MQIRAASVAELLAKGRELFIAHHRESGLELVDPDLNVPLDINIGVFEAMERADILLAFGLFRPPSDELIGYSIGTVTKHHLSSEMVCSACALFVREDHRRNGNGKRLMDVLEAAAELRGARTHWHAKPGSHFARLLEGRRARVLETVYVAALKNLPDPIRSQLLHGEFPSG